MSNTDQHPRLDAVVSGYIYALHAGDEVVRYIGYTTLSPSARLALHLRPSQLSYKTKKNSWVKSVGSQNIRIKILEEHPIITLRGLLNREIELIAHYKLLGAKLTNCTLGGDGSTGHRWSEESKAKRSEARKGKVHSADTRRKISERLTGRTQSPDHLAALSKARKGKKHTAESREINSKSHKGLIRSEDHCRNISKAKAGKPNRGSHTRWHTNKGVAKDDCLYCSGVL